MTVNVSSGTGRFVNSKRELTIDVVHEQLINKGLCNNYQEGGPKTGRGGALS